MIVSFIKEHGKLGACSFCKTHVTHSVPATDLVGLFLPILAFFEIVEPDDPRPHSLLPEALEDIPGWKIFAEHLQPGEKQTLLEAILCHENIDVAAQCSPRMDSPFFQAHEAVWWQFSEDIKWNRRFVFGKNDDCDPRNWLPQCLPEIASRITAHTHVYRAQVGCTEIKPDAMDSSSQGFEPFPVQRMLAPPRQSAFKGGRANPPGISYLYTAEDLTTAIAESRPFIGALVSTLAFAPNRDLKIADLPKATPLASPFGHADLAAKIRALSLLQCLDSELAEPVNPDTDTIDYVPSQYVVEVIRDSGFDGVRYRSAMRRGGHNIAFFNPDDLEPSNSPELFRVEEQQISYKPWKPNNDFPPWVL